MQAQQVFFLMQVQQGEAREFPTNRYAVRIQEMVWRAAQERNPTAEHQENRQIARDGETGRASQIMTLITTLLVKMKQTMQGVGERLYGVTSDIVTEFARRVQRQETFYSLSLYFVLTIVIFLFLSMIS